MGWQFAVAEWIGGIVLISIMSFIVKLSYPKKIVDEARGHGEQSKQAHCDHHRHGGNHHGSMKVEEGSMKMGETSFADKMADPEMRRKIAGNYYMEWSMLWKDLVIGLLIAGLIGVFVPQHVFDILFLKSSPLWVREIVSTIIGPVIAILTFVCSIGNVPLAAIFWSQGMGFSGVLSFLYADLIVIPLLDRLSEILWMEMYRYIFAVFFITMVISGLDHVSLPFNYFHLIPNLVISMFGKR